MQFEEGKPEKCARKEKESKDPGASRHGNFMNYYQFHPAEVRARQLPRGVWRRPTQSTHRKYIGLDVGCNAGELTYVIQKFLQEEIQDQEVHLLGIDLDPTLIERARESNTNPDRLSFHCLDFMSENREKVLKNFLENFHRTHFDVTFCFSITMWIHLNHGDDGLINYLTSVCASSNIVVIEPQLWKSYRNASRRLRRAGAGDFSLLNSLKLTGDVASHIDSIVTDRCGFQRVTVSAGNEWGRRLLIYERTSHVTGPA